MNEYFHLNRIQRKWHMDTMPYLDKKIYFHDQNVKIMGSPLKNRTPQNYYILGTQFQNSG